MNRLLTIALFALLVGCQSGLEDGSLKTTFPPEGWKTTVGDGRTQYLCNPPACTSTELVLVDNLRIVGLTEKLVRDGKIGSDVITKVDAYISRARKGTYKAEAPVPSDTDTYAGFRHKATLDDGGPIIFISGQSIVQGNGGIIVLSMAHSVETADRNLNAYLASTRIERLP
ncbi:MAG: hypothetical protein ABJY83_01260 [Roseibium sp.]